MVLVISMLRWWYTDGWRARAHLIANRLEGTIDYFSFDLLLKTLFSPFRQISAGKVDGPLGVQFQAFLEKLISRVIGAVVRTLILVVGGFVMVAQILFSLIILIGWFVVPTFPFVGVVLTVYGWTF